jgi:uncharacterized membrane protein YedE/YeeE
MNNVVTLAVGIIFGFGLALSGMTHPEKVLGFLDVAGTWDASLMFVLGGAVGVTLITFRVIRRLDKPVLAEEFLLTNARHIDAPLIIGSALFGIGWGISGYCPGPAIALLAASNGELWVFVPAMLLGYALQHFLLRGKQAATTDSDDASVCG